jgi:membrane protease YdiL (CAAX protease family)
MNTAQTIAFFSVTATLVSSFIYFIILEKLKGDKEGKTGPNLIARYVIRKTSGFLILGVIPALAALIFFDFGPAQAGLKIGETFSLSPWIIGASLFFITLNFFNSKNAGLRTMYPELRLKKWTSGGLAIAIGGWILYLAAYEYLFRGLLLFSCLEACGPWLAAAINIALYSALHLPKGMKEAIAAIPFGALICYLTIESGSILPAILLHVLQAVSCELFCIYRNPEMKFHLQKSKQP